MPAAVTDYKDALYRVKRNFLIIGLTGYTGAGCSESRQILSNAEKPIIPNFQAIYSNIESVQCASQDHLHCAVLSRGDRNKRIYDKLATTWDQTPWTKFISIKISAVIFAFAIHRALTIDTQDETLKLIKTIAKRNSLQAKHIAKLWEDKYSNKRTQTELIINIYEKTLAAYSEFKNSFEQTPYSYSKKLQIFGNQIRKYGMVMPLPQEFTPHASNLFLIPEAVRRIIKSYYWTLKPNTSGPYHFVIDAFRNPLEVEYFKWRYREFYLVGILRDEAQRKQALDIPERQFAALKKREKGKLFKRVENLVSSQNVFECLQKSDMFIENIPGEGGTFSSLKFHLIKLIALAKSPGCIPPTKDERNMQFAMTAKQMSGCISRQVGATLVNEKGYVLGVGWNDPPSGQTPCSLRTGNELINGASQTTFSDYERSANFVSHIRENYNSRYPFCFRTELSKIEKGKKNEFTRALHAEENALFQGIARSNGNMNGSTLYTTSCTCTLCAKKAYQLGVSRICYIEEYTDIAVEQTLRVGERKITIDRFQGVVGAAYFQLFSSLIPEKDLIQLYYLSS